MNKVIALFIGLVLCFSVNVAADEEKDLTYDLGQVLVSASRIEEYVAQTGSSVIVIDRKKIEEKKYLSVKDALSLEAGIDLASNSAFGGTTSVFLRGAPSGNTLVLMDGIRLYDPIATDSSYDLANLMLDNVERIEIVKGPQSSLFGSDAMGGVINIITRKGKGKPKFNFYSDSASKRTFTEGLGISGSLGKFYYSTEGSRQDSRGFSKARGGAERDAYQNNNFSGKFSYKPNEDVEFGIKSSYVRAKIDIDSWDFATNSPRDDVDQWSKYENCLITLFGEQRINDKWSHNLDYSWLRNVRKYTDDSDQYWDMFKAWGQETNWQHVLDLGKVFSLPDNISDMLIPGFQYTYESGLEHCNYGDLNRVSANREGFYIENNFGLNNKLFNTLAIRIDRHSRFGTYPTGKVALSYLFPTATRFKGSYGTGFKAPSIYQLFSLYGDTNLEAEKSWGYDAGLEQCLFANRLLLSVTYFHNRFKDLLEFDSDMPNPRIPAYPFGMYVNRGSAKTQGIEAELIWRPLDSLSTRYSFAYVDAMDLSADLHLIRRPNNKHILTVNWRPIKKLDLTFDATRNIKIYDSFAGNPNNRLKDYTVCNFAASFYFNDYFEIYSRIENIFNRFYQEVNGYNTKRRFWHFGMKGKF
ncbi:MAG: TonB-dependent receptor [Candidatus Omnitrophota bacterium]